MREIKFRVWDTEQNEWLAASDPNSLTYYGFHLFGEVMMMQRVHPEELPNLVIQQYTGLKDKNGVEIYEGDIVRLKTGAVGFYEYSEPHLAFAVRIKEPDYDSDDFIISKLDGWYNFDVEVVGNIHENFDLLEHPNA